MKQKLSLPIDTNAREIISYRDPMFPLEIWTGILSHYINKGFPPHWHPEFEYGVVLTGGVQYFFQNYAVSLFPGDSILIKPDRMHYTRQISDEPATLYTLSFPPSLLTKTEQDPLYQKYIAPILSFDFSGLFMHADFSTGKTIHKLLLEIYNLPEHENGFELCALSLLYDLWQKTLQYIEESNVSLRQRHTAKNFQNEACLKRALTFIKEHYNEKISIDDIAKAAYTSRNSCFRYFQKSFGKSPLKVLNDHRLSVAATLLKSEGSVTEIALSCGYASSSYFCKSFHEKFGVTPMEYRAQISYVE